MKKLLKWLLLILLTPLLLYGAYRLQYPTFSWHQQLTFVVETPDGTKTGSAVVQVGVGFDMQILPDAPGFSSGMQGEATVVDLGAGRYLFALLKGSKGLVRDVLKKVDRQALNGLSSEQVYRKITRLSMPLSVPPEQIPMLVTFADMNDPTSVQLVDPDDLAASFGAGYALQSVTLQIVDEPLTEGVVEGILGWLEAHRGKVKPTNKRYSKDLRPEERLYRKDFIVRKK